MRNQSAESINDDLEVFGFGKSGTQREKTSDAKDCSEGNCGVSPFDTLDENILDISKLTYRN